MKKIDIEISDDLEFISRASKIDWRILLTKILKEKIEEINRLNILVSKSSLSEADAEEISSDINESLSKRYT